MANVQGKFYRGETQRPGVTPVSPPNAVDDPQDPLNPPGSGNTTTYKQLGDTTDKDFIGKNGYIPVVVGENALTLQPNIPNTGAAVFGGVVFNSTTTVDIGIVKGYIVDNETDPLVSSVQYIEYAGAVGVTVTTVGSGTRSYGLLKSDGTIHFQNTFPTSEERKQMIYLFKVGHPTGVITVVANEPDFVLSPLQQFRDLFQAFNYVNEGVYPYPDAADLTFNTSAGIIVGNGINFIADTLNPNTLPVAATVPCTFVYRTQTGAGGTPATLITPNSYDNAGTITTVGGGSNRSTLQYIHYSPNLGFVIQYGQTIYDSLVEAISAIGKETHVVYENLIRDAILIGVLALTRTTTDLTDTVDARFYRADIFGQLVGSAAGTSVTTLQRAYLNSLIPQIETVSGELVIKNGGALDTDVVFAIRDLLDVDNFTITGDGDVTANSFIKTGGTSAQYLKADGSVSGVSPYILDQEGASDAQVLTWVAANSRYEPVTPSAGSSNWTVVGSDIYRNSAVAVGRTTIPTGATFAVQAIASGSGNVFQLLNNSASTLVEINNLGYYGFTGADFSIGQGAGSGTHFVYKSSLNGSNTLVFSLKDSLNVDFARWGANGNYYQKSHLMQIGTTTVGQGFIYQSNSTSGGDNVFVGRNSAGTVQWYFKGDGGLVVLNPRMSIGSASATVTNGVYIQGNSNSAILLGISNNSAVRVFDVYGNGNIGVFDSGNVILGTTTGTKFGTATTQKISFWNKTPIIQPTNAITAATFVANTSGIVDDTATFGGYTIGQIAAALINTGILA